MIVPCSAKMVLLTSFAYISHLFWIVFPFRRMNSNHANGAPWCAKGKNHFNCRAGKHPFSLQHSWKRHWFHCWLSLSLNMTRVHAFWRSDPEFTTIIFPMFPKNCISMWNIYFSISFNHPTLSKSSAMTFSLSSAKVMWKIIIQFINQE